MPSESTGEHPPLETYRPGDRAVITCRDHRWEGEEAEVIRFDGYDILVRCVSTGHTDYFSYNTSISPVRARIKRPVSPIFYTVKDPNHVVG